MSHSDPDDDEDYLTTLYARAAANSNEFHHFGLEGVDQLRFNNSHQPGLTMSLQSGQLLDGVLMRGPAILGLRTHRVIDDLDDLDSNAESGIGASSSALISDANSDANSFDIDGHIAGALDGEADQDEDDDDDDVDDDDDDEFHATFASRLRSLEDPDAELSDPPDLFGVESDDETREVESESSGDEGQMIVAPPDLPQVEEQQLQEVWPLGEDSFNIFLCPITHDVLKDPVVAADGYTYERTAITRWFKTSRKSPITGQIMPHTTVFPNQSVRTLLKSLMDMVTNDPAKMTASGQDSSQSEMAPKPGTAGSPDSMLKSKLAIKARASPYGSNSPSTSSSGPPVSAGGGVEASQGGNTSQEIPDIAARQSPTRVASSGGSGVAEDEIRPPLGQRPHTSNNPSGHDVGQDLGCSADIGQLQRPASQPQVPSVTLPPLRARQALPVSSEPRAPTGSTPPAHGMQFVQVPQFAQLQRSSVGSRRPAPQPPPFPPPAGPPPEVIPAGVTMMSQTMPSNMGVNQSGRGRDFAAIGSPIEA